MATMADLTTAIQQLNQEVTNLKIENVALKAILDEKPPVVLDPPTTAMSIEKYAGDPFKLKEFCTAYKIQFMFRPHHFLTDKAKIGFVVSHLTANALSWVTPHLDDTDPIMQSFPAFETAFKEMFSRVHNVRASEEGLLDISQGTKDLMTYITCFHSLAAETKWSDEVQLAIFRRGLKEELKDELARIDRPITMKAMIDLVLQIDFRIQERRIERKKYSVPRLPIRVQETKPIPENTEEPMQLGVSRGPLTSTERQHRRAKGLCMYCGKAGHNIMNCPICPRKPSEN